MRDKMAEDNQDSKLKLSGYETFLLNCIGNLHANGFKHFLDNGANPHYEGEDSKNAFRRIADWQEYPNPEVRRIGNQMSKNLLEHELKRTNNYLLGTPPVEGLPSQQIQKQVQLHSPRSVVATSHVDKYLNEPMKKLSI